ncbi:MAG: hypothetical protein U0271_42030 [Polyangiaceae bacterium]
MSRARREHDANFGIAVAVGGLGVAAQYLGDLGSSIARIARGSGTSSMKRAERVMAMEDLLAIAVLADGRLHARELEELHRLIASGASAADAAVSRVLPRAAELRSADALRSAIQSAAVPLDESEREEVFSLVVELAHAGAGAYAASSSYRSEAVADPEELLAAFAESLALPDYMRQKLTLRTRAKLAKREHR